MISLVNVTKSAGNFHIEASHFISPWKLKFKMSSFFKFRMCIDLHWKKSLFQKSNTNPETVYISYRSFKSRNFFQYNFFTFRLRIFHKICFRKKIFPKVAEKFTRWISVILNIWDVFVYLIRNWLFSTGIIYALISH